MAEQQEVQKGPTPEELRQQAAQAARLANAELASRALKETFEASQAETLLLLKDKGSEAFPKDSNARKKAIETVTAENQMIERLEAAFSRTDFAVGPIGSTLRTYKNSVNERLTVLTSNDSLPGSKIEELISLSKNPTAVAFRKTAGSAAAQQAIVKDEMLARTVNPIIGGLPQELAVVSDPLASKDSNSQKLASPSTLQTIHNLAVAAKDAVDRGEDGAAPKIAALAGAQYQLLADIKPKFVSALGGNESLLPSAFTELMTKLETLSKNPSNDSGVIRDQYNALADLRTEALGPEKPGNAGSAFYQIFKTNEARAIHSAISEPIATVRERPVEVAQAAPPAQQPSLVDQQYQYFENLNQTEVKNRIRLSVTNLDKAGTAYREAVNAAGGDEKDAHVKDAKKEFEKETKNFKKVVDKYIDEFQKELVSRPDGMTWFGKVLYQASTVNGGLDGWGYGRDVQAQRIKNLVNKVETGFVNDYTRSLSYGQGETAQPRLNLLMKFMIDLGVAKNVSAQAAVGENAIGNELRGMWTQRSGIGTWTPYF